MADTVLGLIDALEDARAKIDEMDALLTAASHAARTSRRRPTTLRRD